MNKYHNAMDQIRTPPALKDKTRKMMIAQMQQNELLQTPQPAQTYQVYDHNAHAQQVYAPQTQPVAHTPQTQPVHAQHTYTHQPQTKVRKSRRLQWNLSAIAAVLVLVIGLSIWMNVNVEDDLIVTNLIQNEHTEAVVLQTGELHFLDISTNDLQPPIRFAPNFPLRRNLSLDEHQGVLPADLPYGLSEPEGGVTAFFEDPTGDPVAILGSAYYHVDSGGLFTVAFTDDSSLLFSPLEVNGDSQIDGIPIGVGFLETDGAYYATYIRDGYTFLLTAEGMTQRQFIYLLVHFVTH